MLPRQDQVDQLLDVTHHVGSGRGDSSERDRVMRCQVFQVQYNFDAIAAVGGEEKNEAPPQAAKKILPDSLGQIRN